MFECLSETVETTLPFSVDRKICKLIWISCPFNWSKYIASTRNSKLSWKTTNLTHMSNASDQFHLILIKSSDVLSENCQAEVYNDF